MGWGGATLMPGKGKLWHRSDVFLPRTDASVDVVARKQQRRTIPVCQKSGVYAQSEKQTIYAVNILLPHVSRTARTPKILGLTIKHEGSARTYPDILRNTENTAHVASGSLTLPEHPQTFLSPGLMSMTSPLTYLTQGLAILIGSVMLRTSTVPTEAAASMGVKTK